MYIYVMYVTFLKGIMIVWSLFFNCSKILFLLLFFCQQKRYQLFGFYQFWRDKPLILHEDAHLLGTFCTGVGLFN